MSAQESKTNLTKLEQLAALLRDDGVNPEDMTDEHLVRYLKEHKVDMSQPQIRFAAISKKAKARHQLEGAREKRLQAAGKVHVLLTTGTGAYDEVKEKVRAMIQKLKQHDPDQALVYAREFEKATSEDLKLLEEDLTLLELEDSKDAAGD
jgi:hypothetical protein